MNHNRKNVTVTADTINTLKQIQIQKRKMQLGAKEGEIKE
jgi:hypothetical protein